MLRVSERKRDGKGDKIWEMRLVQTGEEKENERNKKKEKMGIV